MFAVNAAWACQSHMIAATAYIQHTTQLSVKHAATTCKSNNQISLSAIFEQSIKSQSLHMLIGGIAYWAGRAAARPLFAPNGQALMFALPHFAH